MRTALSITLPAGVLACVVAVYAARGAWGMVTAGVAAGHEHGAGAGARVGPGTGADALAVAVVADTAFRMLTADNCLSCHNSVVSPAGADVSIGSDWRASIMANSARDPYWQAAVRREMMDHPSVASDIQADCARCHMPMLYVERVGRGERPQVFPHLPIRDAETRLDSLAADGVSCALCHRISAERLGTRESFTGGFIIDSTKVDGHGRVFGPYEVDPGRAVVMRSASTFHPSASAHVRTSELCATCHTLFREVYDENDRVIAAHPEQTPYLEWLASDFRGVQGCQSCHMRTIPDSVPISSVLGQPRPEVSRHWFVGGNFFVLRMLNRYRDELGVEALPHELDEAIERTIAFLRTETARVTVERAEVVGDRLEAIVGVENLTGHKLPTAYPSRRVWLNVVVLDAAGDVVFESGALRQDGSIVGNDNDADPAFYEPHYEEITAPDEVQIYETILATPDGAVTTGLSSAIRYVKDNRLPPRGFDKRSASREIAVHGRALEDPDFTGGADRVRYRIAVDGERGPFRVVATLWFQPISFRWAQNLRPYEAFEPQRFLRYFEEMAPYSAVVLAKAEAVAR